MTRKACPDCWLVVYNEYLARGRYVGDHLPINKPCSVLVFLTFLPLLQLCRVATERWTGFFMSPLLEAHLSAAAGRAAQPSGIRTTHSPPMRCGASSARTSVSCGSSPTPPLGLCLAPRTAHTRHLSDLITVPSTGSANNGGSIKRTWSVSETKTLSKTVLKVFILILYIGHSAFSHQFRNVLIFLNIWPLGVYLTQFSAPFTRSCATVIRSSSYAWDKKRKAYNRVTQYPVCTSCWVKVCVWRLWKLQTECCSAVRQAAPGGGVSVSKKVKWSEIESKRSES